MCEIALNQYIIVEFMNQIQKFLQKKRIKLVSNFKYFESKYQPNSWAFSKHLKDSMFGRFIIYLYEHGFSNQKT